MVPCVFSHISSLNVYTNFFPSDADWSTDGEGRSSSAFFESFAPSAPALSSELLERELLNEPEFEAMSEFVTAQSVSDRAR